MTIEKDKNKIPQPLLRYLTLLIGTAILAFGLFNIHSRSGISEGGALGLSLLLYRWFKVSPGISAFFIDAICLGIGWFVLGKQFLTDSILASVMYSCWYELFEYAGPVLPDFSDHPLVAAILGGLFVGVGCGLVVLNNCAAGGDDALALVFHHKTGMSLTLFYVFSDFTILLLSLTYIPLRRIVWSMLTVLISSGVIEIMRKFKPAA